MILKKGDLCKHFKGKNLQEKNIYEVLEMRVEEALEFFENFPKIKNISERF